MASPCGLPRAVPPAVLQAVPGAVPGAAARAAAGRRTPRCPEMILMDVADVPEYAVDVAFIPMPPR